MKIAGFAGGDRTTLDLPAGQEDLLKKVLATGKPVIVVLLNGSAVAVTSAAAQAHALLEAWYPGQEGGMAIANTLTGENNPAGRLPVTFYRSIDQLPPFDDYSMKARTYRYFTGSPLFEFGYGLSYSTFVYSNTTFSDGAIFSIVKNTSAREGDEVVQLYRKHGGNLPELKGFQRIHLRAGESRTVSFNSTNPLSDDDNWYIGGGQPPK